MVRSTRSVRREPWAARPSFETALTRLLRMRKRASLPRHFGLADAVAVELLVVVHGDRDPQQSDRKSVV